MPCRCLPYFPSSFLDDSLISLIIKTTITSKGKHQERIGKETFSHLSAFTPINTAIPIEATTSEDSPAYRISSLFLLDLSRWGNFCVFNFLPYISGLSVTRRSRADSSRGHMTLPIEVGRRLDLQLRRLEIPIHHAPTL